jgi:signal transduction histidine kinase/AmiR/NasT family two-component response regulator
MRTDYLHLLLVDDSEDQYWVIRDRLAEIAGWTVTLDWMHTYDAVLAHLTSRAYDVALIADDLGEGQPAGVDLIRAARAIGCATPLILLAVNRERAGALAALAAGATDVLAKTDLTAPLLERAVRYTCEQARTIAALQASEARCRAMLASVDQAIAERERAEQALAAERASLAQRVAERTADLRLANQELARAARHKDEFLASMSHELRTPLNTILGLAEALREQLYGPLDEEHITAVRGIEESSWHLLSLINDILDLAKVAAGKLELDIDTVSVEAVCQASLQLITSVALKKQLDIVTQIDRSVATIQADARRLKQILVNLLANAVKFTPSGGTLGLEVVGDPSDRVVRFTVWDTGAGIAEDDLPRLFQSFVQIGSSPTRQHQGSGLGLALAARMVELHNGSITVESALGQGSRFTIRLPWEELAEDSRSAGAVESIAVGRAGQPVRRALVFEDSPPVIVAYAQARQSVGELSTLEGRVMPFTILLAEDNESNIAMLVPYLQTKGYQVVVARNGAEAIERAHGVRPAIILMDIQMTGMDGLEATRRIRADDSLATTPIIAVTALAMPGDRERCLAAGANAYLSKPVSLKGLIAAIETQLWQHAQAQHSGAQHARAPLQSKQLHEKWTGA